MVTYDHHREDEARWIAAMRQRHARGQEYVCGLADALRTLEERDEARAEVERMRGERDEALVKLDCARTELEGARSTSDYLLDQVNSLRDKADMRLSFAEKRLSEMTVERDEARAEVERLRDEHKGLVEELTRAINGMELSLSFEQQDRLRYQAELAALRDEIGEAWFADDCDTITALRRKMAMLQRLADGGGE